MADDNPDEIIIGDEGITTVDDGEVVDQSGSNPPDPSQGNTESSEEAADDDSGGGSSSSSSSSSNKQGEQKSAEQIAEQFTPEDPITDNPDTRIEDSSGFRLQKDELVERIESGNTEDLGPAVPGFAGQSPEQKVERRKELNEKERERREEVNQTLQDEQASAQEKAEAVEKAANIVGGQEGVKLDQAAEELKKRQEQVENREPQILLGQRPQNNDNPVENAAGRFVDLDRQVDENLDFSEEAVLAGQDIIQRSEEIGEAVIERVDPPEILGAGPGGLIAGAEQASRGQVIEGVETALLPGVQNELERRRSEQIQEGIVAGPGTLGGFVIGGSGAVATSIEESDSLQEFGGDVAGGASRIAGQASEDPGEFAAQEAGEEIGEGVLTAGIGTVAPTITPDVTPEVRVPSSVQTSERFVTGNLGTRATETNIIGDTEATQFFETEFEPREEGGRRQIVRGQRVNERGEIEGTLLGERVETPVNRRQFLQERTGLKDAELTDFIDSNTLGSGVGAFVPDTQTPETDTTPESDIDPENLFREPETPESNLPDTVEVPTGDTRTGLSPTITPEQSQSQEPELDQTPRQEQSPFEELEPFQEPETRIEEITRPEESVRVETIVSPELVFEEERKIDRTVSLDPETRFDPTTSLTPEPGNENNLLVFGGEDDAGGQDTRFAPSVDALIFGETVSEEQAQQSGLLEQEFTGTETRPLIEDSNSDDEISSLF